MTSGTMALIRKGDEFFPFFFIHYLFHRFPLKTLNAESVFAVFFALVTRQSAVSGKMALMRPILFGACLIESDD